MPNIFEFVLVEQIFTDFTNSKPKFDFGAKPTISENEDFFQKDAEVWNLISYNGDHKSRTGVLQFGGLYAQAKFQVLSFNNLKDIHDFPIC